MRGDLIRILGGLLQRADRFDYILIETTGLADPAPVAQTFFVDEDVKASMQLDGIVTVCDAKHLLTHLDEKKPDGVENESVEQLAFADRVLLNKIDLVTEAELAEIERRIHTINGTVKIIRTQHAKVNLDAILGLGAFTLQKALDIDPNFLVDQEHQHDASVSSVGLDIKGEVALDQLNQWLSKLLRERGADIFRLKGVLAVKGHKEKFVFQGVHMLLDAEPFSKWKPNEERTCKMVFIGRRLDRDELRQGFESCLAN